MNQLDCRHWLCPKPVIEVRKILLAAPDEPLAVLVEDAVARQNLLRLAESLNWVVTETQIEGVPTLEFAPQEVECTVSLHGTTVVLVAAQTMGNGSDELGVILMRNFLLTLAELDLPPSAVFFINEGVKLVVENAETVEILEKLADIGVDLASCGLCLDFYGLKEKVKVGRITNMLDIVQSMAKADRVLRP